MHNNNVTAKCCHANDDRVQVFPVSGIHLCVHMHECRFMSLLIRECLDHLCRAHTAREDDRKNKAATLALTAFGILEANVQTYDTTQPTFSLLHPVQ